MHGWDINKSRACFIKDTQCF